MTQFLFTRHGASQANKDGVIADATSPLTKQGQAQARKLARSLKKQGIVTIVSSPLPRAFETAQIIARQLGIADVTVLDELRERGFGVFEGKRSDHPTEWYFMVNTFDSIEPAQQMIDRTMLAVQKITALADQGPMLVIGHAVAGFYLLQVAAGKRRLSAFEPFTTELTNAEPITITVTPEPRAPIKLRKPHVALAGVVAAVVIVGLVLIGMQNQPAPHHVKHQTITLSPEDYNNDPHLQGAIQQLQQQNGMVQQPGNGVGNILQPVQSLPGGQQSVQ